MHHVIEAVLPVHCHLRHPIIIQEKESAVTVNDLLYLRCPSRLQDPPETLRYFIVHRQLSGARVRLGFLDHVLHVAGALELVIDVENLVLHIDVPHRQPAEFGDPDARTATRSLTSQR